MLAKGDYAAPIAPQTWHFRQSIDYSITANYAVLDFAQRYRETLLYNIYVMGRNAIERGKTDHWTDYPRRVAEVKAEIAKEMKTESSDPRMVAGGRAQVVPTKYFALLRKPEWRDARGYVLPADEGDFLTATKFVNALIKAGVTVQRATAPFSAGGKQYPAGSYVVKAAQAFRPHVLDMFEPQDHPNDFQYPGGPPIPPYDNAGWTLAFQMGVKFDRAARRRRAPFEALDRRGEAGGRHGDVGGGHDRLRHRAQAERRVHGGQPADEGGRRGVLRAQSQLAERRRHRRDLRAGQGHDGGGAAEGRGRSGRERDAASASVPPAAMYKLAKPRIGLWDQYGGSMPSGHVRWLLEQFEFDFEVVYPQTLDAGNLKAKYDVLLFPDGGIPENARRRWRRLLRPAAARRRTSPSEYRAHLGRVTVGKTVPQLKRFAEEGGVIVAFGGSAMLGHHLGLPVSDHLVEMQADGSERPLPGTKYYIPGSILRVAVDNTVAARLRLRTRGRRVLRQQPGAGAGAECVAEGHPPGGVVRRQGARCARDGRGASTISKAAPRRSRRRWARARCSSSGRRSRSARSRTARSSSCSTASTTARRRQAECPRERRCSNSCKGV